MELYHLTKIAFSPGYFGTTPYPHLVCDYDNFVYACRRCNSAKRDVATLDPTKVAMGEHLQIDTDGQIRALSPEGKVLILRRVEVWRGGLGSA